MNKSINIKNISLKSIIELSIERTILANERTLLAQIRTASIFIGVTYLIFYKISDSNKIFKNLIGLILLIICIANLFSVYLFYKKTGEKINEDNMISLIYGCMLSILVCVSLFYIIYYSINKKK